MGFKQIGRRGRIVQEFFHFLWEQKLWWMMPMMALLILFAALRIFAQSTAIGPFIYTLF
jgi:hypothetical protein